MSKEHNVLFTKAVNFRFCGLFSIDGVLSTASPDLLQAAKAHKKRTECAVFLGQKRASAHCVASFCRTWRPFVPHAPADSTNGANDQPFYATVELDGVS